MKTETVKKKKTTIETMREIRENLSHEIMEMTFEQEKEFIKKQLEKLKRSTRN